MSNIKVGVNTVQKREIIVPAKEDILHKMRIWGIERYSDCC